MNYIHTLQDRTAAQAEQITAAREEVEALMSYLLSAKFAGPDNDYVHVSTDMLPKLRALRSTLVA